MNYYLKAWALFGFGMGCVTGISGYAVAGIAGFVIAVFVGLAFGLAGGLLKYWWDGQDVRSRTISQPSPKDEQTVHYWTLLVIAFLTASTAATLFTLNREATALPFLVVALITFGMSRVQDRPKKDKTNDSRNAPDPS